MKSNDYRDLLLIYWIYGEKTMLLSDTQEVDCVISLDLPSRSVLDLAGSCIVRMQEVGRESCERVGSLDVPDCPTPGPGIASDIRTDPDLLAAVVFHTPGFPTSVCDADVDRMRAAVDEALSRATGLRLRVSGHFWYPPGGGMGWHSNLRKPGKRLYLVHNAVPALSSFLYRDPETGKVHSVREGSWSLREFRTTPDLPLWHAVRSGTDRFAFGYHVED